MNSRATKAALTVDFWPKPCSAFAFSGWKLCPLL